MTAQRPLLEAREIAKTYGHVTALDGASLSVYPGQVCALIGDNGAGKSTMVKVLSGTTSPDRGEILLEGRPVTLSSPVAAQQLGIATVYQDLALAPELSAPDNLFMGRERLRGGLAGRLGFLDRPGMQQEATRQFAALGINLREGSAPVGSLSGGQRQSIAIARAVLWADKVVLLDEPTAALGIVQTARVTRLVRQVAEQGLGVVLISHNMPEVLEVADRVEVLRLGRRVATFTRQEMSVERLVRAMTSGESNPEEAA